VVTTLFLKSRLGQLKLRRHLRNLTFVGLSLPQGGLGKQSQQIHLPEA